MTARGKSINLFLVDGDTDGLIKCTMANWTGVAYKIPRTKLEQYKSRQELNQSGVYFLLGISDATGKGVVYVGQAGARKNGEGLLNRLTEHKRSAEKDYWSEAIVFTTANNTFGPTEISYLENRFTNIAKEADRYEVKNGNDPNPGNITEEKECELEEFIDYAKIIVGALGHKLFLPMIMAKEDQLITPADEEAPLLYLKRKIKSAGITVEATGRQTSDGFVVLPGSTVCPEEKSYVPDSIRIRRKQAVVEENILQKAEQFGSPSMAAEFVIGSTENGLTAWKTKEGITLKELESRKSE